MTTPDQNVTTKKPSTTLTVFIIYKLHPRLVTVATQHSRPITINLPITRQVYTTLLHNMSQTRFADYLPLVFYIDKTGVAYRVIPLAQANEEAEKQQQTTPNTR